VFAIILTNKVNNKKYDYLLYVGDFNFREIDWENNNTNVGPEHLASKFLEFLYACGGGGSTWTTINTRN
jgi:hypothetical protein